MSIRTDGPDFCAPYRGQRIDREVKADATDGRRHESMDGAAYGADGVVVVSAWRWLDPRPRYPGASDLDQRGHFMAVMPNGTSVWEHWTRTPRSRIKTTAGLARVARAWLKRVRAEWEAQARRSS